MTKDGKTYKVGISGSYGGLNLGDEAILRSIIDQLRSSLPVEITVFSRNPEDTLRRHGVEKSVPVRDLIRSEVCPEIENLDLFILGGGGILFDAEAEMYLREVVLAQQFAIPVLIYAVGAGPLKERGPQKMVRDALNQAAVVTVRERKAQRILEEVGVSRKIILTADPALVLKPEPISEELLVKDHLSGKHHLIGMSVREPGPAAPDIRPDSYHALLADAADYMVDRFDANVVFVPMERRMLDMQHSHAVISKMLHPQRAWVLKEEYTSGQMLSLMKRFDFAVGMRLHFLIFAALQEVPFVALPYSSKVLGFLEELQIEVPPIHLVNAGRLIAHIDRFWDSKDSLRAKIRQALPDLQQRASETNRIAVSLLDGSFKPEANPASEDPLTCS
ncbi:MAG: polysaccharide pyruvyl transferase [Desulfobacteraceae bacterium]|nr:MAG: polysaccharide pyruvyl transferase [Desulfobacteraceae bacterium]